MRVYLAPIIIVALLVAGALFLLSCSTGFRGSIGSAHPAPQEAPAMVMR